MQKPILGTISPKCIEYTDPEFAWIVGGMYRSHNGFIEAVKYQCPNMGQVTMGEKIDEMIWLLPKLGETK